MARSTLIALSVALAVTLGATPAAAQYFGQNKVQYRTFDFQILETEHFDLYYYPEAEAMARDVARMAERWYTRLSHILEHQLSTRQPLVLYASSPHFQQTNVVEGILGEGTGGVTESLKRRIVMPVGAGPAETDHVLGHELVHAFQYDILGPRANLPLWFMEGMAEYLSIGSIDAHTAVWLRDAAINERLPKLRDLYNPRYFPYRFGHAFWAYVGGRWGDDTIAQILQAAIGARGGGPGGGVDPIALIESVLGLDADELARRWHESILATMLRPLGDRARNAGPRLIEPDDEEELNVGPALSPDGSRLAFLSSRHRLSIDLFVAETASGRIQRKLISTATDPHFDSLQFISSAGSWDPTGQKLAVAAIREGRAVIAIYDVNNGRRLHELRLPNVDEAFTPAWSPNGQQIAFSGLSDGATDLYLCDVATEEVRQLTDDGFGDLQPAWSPDGTRIVFISDRFSTRLDLLRIGEYELAIMDLASHRTTELEAFDEVRHNSPQWGRDGLIYFVATPDGVPDVYRVSASGGTPVRLTRLITGVTGITATSPSLSLAVNANRLATVVYRNSTYEIQSVATEALQLTDATPPPITTVGARLAPADRTDGEVDRVLASPQFGLTESPTAVEDYKPRLSLDYMGQQFGISMAPGIGQYAGGGIAMMFSDMLGDHVLTSVAQVNGRLEDFGGQVGYINRKHRWNWGTFLEYVPYVTGGVFGSIDTVNGEEVFLEQQVRDRQVDRRLVGLGSYPFSRARRVEFGASIRHLTFDREIETRGFSLQTGNEVFRDSSDTSLGNPLKLGELTTAFVQDTSVFGPTSPILGHRSRLELSPAWGDLTFTTVIADARHYVMPVRPVTIAARVLHVGRYGNDSESLRLSPLFLGYPTLVRGYDYGSFDLDECQITPQGTCSAVDDLIGSRLLVAGAEVRAPIVGLFTGGLDYGPVPAELLAFFDAGVAWDRNSRPSGFGDGDRPWARSVGAGVRVNVFGFAIVELAAARALDRPNNGWRFVFGLTPGY